MSLLAARIADENIETAEFFHGVGDESGAERLIAKVARQGHRVASGILNQFDHFLRVRLLVRIVVDGDVGAFARIGDGGRAAHAAVAAGDQRPSSGQPPAALVAGLAVIGLGLHFARKSRPGLRLALERRLRVFANGVLHALHRFWRG
jgi:hypothetical protein